MSLFRGIVKAIAGEPAAAVVTPEETRRLKRQAEHEATQERGRQAFIAYHGDNPYAAAKLAAGMTFTPESVAYMERELTNRRIAAEIYAENTKDMEHVDPVSPVSPDGDERHSSPAWNGSGSAGPVQN